jgi:predicted nuclease of predicted toxin-antitoxin system
VVLTHDRDFGTLAIHAGEPYFGIVYLRPGHISAEFTWRTIAAIESTVESVEPPFVVVAARRGDMVRIRVRSGTG